MDLFGLKDHEQQHKDLERHVRRLVEQVAQLTIDLGETRMQLRKLALEVERQYGSAGLDPNQKTALIDFRMEDAEEFIL